MVAMVEKVSVSKRCCDTIVRVLLCIIVFCVESDAKRLQIQLLDRKL